MDEPEKVKILLAGCEQYLLEQLQESLKKDGSDVQVVLYTEEALKETAEWMPDLIFLQALADTTVFDAPTFLTELKKRKASALAIMVVLTPFSQVADTEAELRGFTHKITYEESKDLIASVQKFISTFFAPHSETYSKRKILLVDDCSLQRKMMTSLLKFIPGYEILHAVDGLDAIEQLGVHYRDIKLVISDWNMPRLSGIQFIEAFSKVKQVQQIPLVMVTANHEDAEMKSAYRIYPKLGGYLLKPFTPVRFREFVMPFLSK